MLIAISDATKAMDQCAFKGAMVVAYFEVKVLWMYQAMDHEEIIRAIDQGVSYRSGSKLWVRDKAIDL